MSVIRRNLIANFAGQGWIALMGFLFVPFYLAFIGAEGYGLVGFFILLSSTLSLLDMGFDVTATRQIALFLLSGEDEKRKIASLLRSIESLFWLIAVFAGTLTALAAPWIAVYWLKVESQTIPQVVAGIRLMAVALVVQFPIDFYSGCLVGLEKQVKLNTINCVSATLRGVGAVLALWLISPTIQTFFVWQCILSLFTVIWLRHTLWKAIGNRAAFRWIDIEALRQVGRFTAGVGGINVLAYLLTQVDKIILSKVLPLGDFGYYTLAWSLGTFAYRLTGPIFNAFYPQIAQLVTHSNPEQLQNPGPHSELVRLYLKASRVMAVAIVPLSIWLAFFGKPLLTLWTHNPAIAQSAFVAAGLIALGTMFNGLMHVPYGVQLAKGWLSLAFWTNTIAVILIVPLTYYFGTRYGLSGAAIPWLLLNLGYVVVGAPLMYKKLLRNTKWDWYRTSVVYPILQAALLTAAFYYLAMQITSHWGATVMMGMTLVVSVGIAALSSGLIRMRELIRLCRAYV
jgi:O-antigen/teichoic acid export membrane protein